MDQPVDVVQVDDGDPRTIGDWLTPSPRFTSVTVLAARIRDTGRRAGVWTAPFLAGVTSAVVAEHPDWWVRDCSAGTHREQQLRAIDVTHPAAAAHLADTFRALRTAGFDNFKLDFRYAGALSGRGHDDPTPFAAYRRGDDLGAWGPATHRRLLRPSTTTPRRWLIDLDGNQGRIDEA